MGMAGGFRDGVTGGDDRAGGRTGRDALPGVTGLLLIVEAVILAVSALVLGAIFDFPDILREPAGVVLNRFNENPGSIRATYYVFLLSSLLLVPIALSLHDLLSRGRAPVLLNVATTFGILTGLTQLLGFIRWPIMMPYLADTYANPQSSQATRDAVVVTYETFNRYAGMAIGEHLGWVFTGLWLIFLSVVMVESPIVPRWMGLAGVVIGAAFLVSTLEQFRIGLEDELGLLNFAVNTVFSFWLIALAVVLFRARPSAGRSTAGT